MSNNHQHRLSNQEQLTMYHFGHLQGFNQQRRIYDYFFNHWREWFPPMPSCQAFNSRLNQLTPIACYKRHRYESESDVPTYHNRFVSAIRQPLESLFHWLIQKTDLQNASRVRSSQGLKVNCYGKLAVACLLLTFYS